jgi:hypothetical protein
MSYLEGDSLLKEIERQLEKGESNNPSYSRHDLDENNEDDQDEQATVL